MAYKIEQIEGIGKTYGDKLRAAGIATVTQLLKAGGDAKGRKALAGTTGLDESRLLEWVNRADLMRIKGIGTQYSDLLEAAGVDTVKELKMRNAGNLAARMAEINGEKKLTRAVPAEKMVAGWIEQAKGLAAAITH
jgi:predicted flap endonuclease-1-like 5' DNA nuclease